jgi:hypothetical protein
MKEYKMQFNISFELQGSQVAPLTAHERERLEEKVHARVKEAVSIMIIDNNLVLLKKINTLEVDLV